jgi:hypothetical protein
VVAAGAIHLADAPGVQQGLRRAALAAGGVFAVVVAVMAVYGAAGMSWTDRLATYAANITQGEFSEGWRLPLEYLWHAEHLLLIAWLLAAAWTAWRWRWALRSRLARAGMVGAVSVYALLAISSTGLHRFVVYGRLSRPLVPFLCLVTAAALGSYWRSEIVTTRVRVASLSVLIVFISVQAAVNFRIPLTQEFPADFDARVARVYPGPRIQVNVRHLYPGPEPFSMPAGFHEAAAAAHPLRFKPYQYEGYTAEERHLLRTEDLRMRIVVPATP